MELSQKNNFEQLLWSGLLTDIELSTVDQAKAKVHSILLSTLDFGWYSRISQRIKIEEQSQKLFLSDANRDVLIVLLDLIYGSPIKLQPLTIWKVVHFANTHRLYCLLNKCFDYIQDRITVHSCIHILKCCIVKEHTILCKARCFIKKHFVQVLKLNEHFYDIDHTQLVDLLNDDRLNVPNEEMVWQTIVLWIGHKPDLRISILPQVVQVLRFGRCNLNFIHQTIASHPYVKAKVDNEKCIQQMIDTYGTLEKGNYKRDGFFKLVSNSLASIKPRIPNSMILLHGGWINALTSDSIETYDTQTNLWFKHNTFAATNRSYHGIEFFDGKLYLIGGSDGNEVVQTLICFDLIQNVRTILADMHECRCYVSTVYLNGCIYAMGGHNGTNRTDTCEMYKVNQNRWFSIASMKVVRSDACAAVYRGKIYIAGGLNDSNVENSVEVYDPERDLWTLVEPMSSPRTSFAFIYYHRKLYALGGNDGLERLDTVECYDPEKNRWTSIADMPSRRSTFKATVFDDNIYAIGGYNGERPNSEVERYNDCTKKWTQEKPLHQERSGFAVITIENVDICKKYTFHGVNQR